MNKIISAILVCLLTVFQSLSFAIVFDTNDVEILEKNDSTYMIKKYSISADEENLFESTLVQNFEENGLVYKIEDVEKAGGNIILNKNVVQSETIETTEDSIEEILKKLPKTVIYDTDDYQGTLYLDFDSIKTEKISEGSYNKKYTVYEDVKFSNYTPNDLYEIPKIKYKNGVKMKLLNVDWRVQSTEYVAGSQVPILYSGTCHYAGTGVKKIEGESKYLTTAEYNGEVSKEEINNVIYTITYKQVKENNNMILLVVLVTLACIFGTMYFLLRKRVKIYNFNDEKFCLVGNKLINYNNPVIDLTKYKKDIKTNMFKIVLDKNITKRLYGKKIKIVGNAKTIQHQVENYNIEEAFDIYI
ncbi:MAG: hypothetical protein J6C46_01995 [Clostridia bacterium]|nr:hypothetical protein [Clostridia bacterium]